VRCYHSSLQVQSSDMYPQVRTPTIIFEEICNSILHGIGILATVSAILWINLSSFVGRNTLQVIGVYFFLATVAYMYLISTLYHSLSFTKARKVFLILDYGAVFLVIAGTYTAFIAATLQTSLGLLSLIIIWVTAITVITLRSIFHKKYGALFLGIYLLLGWFALFLVKIAWNMLETETILLIIIGGICYTIGTVALSIKKVPFTHTVWHALVMAGTACHFMALILL
jgi:hemolysin III